jgi:hypothetical protein
LETLIVARAQEAEVDAELAVKIAFCESTLRQFGQDGEALRGIHNSDDVGLFQINEKFHLAKSQKLGYDIHTTEGNIAYAMWLLANEGAKPWHWSKPCWSK